MERFSIEEVYRVFKIRDENSRFKSWYKKRVKKGKKESKKSLKKSDSKIDIYA